MVQIQEYFYDYLYVFLEKNLNRVKLVFKYQILYVVYFNCNFFEYWIEERNLFFFVYFENY